MITVVIPLYNKVSFISQTLDSVAAQTYTDYEVIVVDDGSTDGSPEVVANHPLSTGRLDCFVPRNDAKRSQQPTANSQQPIADPQPSTANYQLSTDSQLSTLNSKLRLIRQTNAGVSTARNRGIEEAQGEFIAFLDADDEWKPDYLATQMTLVEKYSECVVFATNYEFRDEKGNVTPTIIRKLPFEGEDGELTNYFEVASHSHPPLWTSAVMVRKAVIQSIGGFPVGIKSGEDLLTWARLVAKYRIAWCKKSQAEYYTPTTGPTGAIPVDLKTTRDAVGTALISLRNENKNLKTPLALYINFWYKMRAVINLKLGNRWAAIRCALKAIQYYPFRIKPYLIIMLSCIPKLVHNKP